jgi:pimeloyl-ACP methyl ester carboxylesterase
MSKATPEWTASASTPCRDRAGTGIKKGYVDTDTGQIHYRMSARGSGRPLVLLHQTASSSQMYEALMQQLDGEFFMLAPDTPGFGQSDFPRPAPTIADYVTTLLQTVDHLGIKDMAVFGHHTGASIACEMAVRAPERVTHLILSGPPYMDATERERWLQQAVQPMVIQADGSHLMQIWRRVTRHDPVPSPALAHREVVDNLRAGERWHEAYVAVFTQDFPSLLAQVRCPTLLMCGADDLLKPYFPPACDALPYAQHVMVPGTTFAVDDYPAEVAAAIRAFLAV